VRPESGGGPLAVGDALLGGESGSTGFDGEGGLL
jgi:hypothetical protein